MTAATYLRRIDDGLVEAVRYTGDNLAELQALAGGRYRVTEGKTRRLAPPPGDPQERQERLVVAPGDWVVRDGRSAYAVRSYAFRGHCREVPVE